MPSVNVELQKRAGKLIGSIRGTILTHLGTVGRTNVTGLCAVTGHRQPSVSAQLKELRNTGLVAHERDGQHMFYSLADGGELGAVVRDMLGINGSPKGNGKASKASKASPKATGRKGK